jgi:hypothetical protein
VVDATARARTTVLDEDAMKVTKLSVICLLLLPFGAGCDGDVKAGKEGGVGIEGLDVEKLGVDGMKQKVSEIASSLTSKLQGIQDEAGAIDFKKTAEPMLQQLDTLKTSLGASLPDLSDLRKAADAVETKFKGNDAVMKVLQPVLDQVRKLTA